MPAAVLQAAINHTAVEDVRKSFLTSDFLASPDQRSNAIDESLAELPEDSAYPALSSLFGNSLFAK